jgi:hypothetical protein
MLVTAVGVHSQAGICAVREIAKKVQLEGMCVGCENAYYDHKFLVATNGEANVPLLDTNKPLPSSRVSVVVRGRYDVVACIYLLVDGPGMAYMKLVDVNTSDSDEQPTFDGQGHRSVLQTKLTKLALQISYIGGLRMT